MHARPAIDRALPRALPRYQCSPIPFINYFNRRFPIPKTICQKQYAKNNKVFGVNVFGAAYIAKAFINQAIKKGPNPSGHRCEVVTTASIVGVLPFASGLYSMSKYAAGLISCFDCEAQRLVRKIGQIETLRTAEKGGGEGEANDKATRER